MSFAWGGAILKVIVLEGMPLCAVNHIAQCSSEDVDETADFLDCAPAPRLVTHHLSHAETGVLLWFCRGYTTSADIGGKLHRSPNTVRSQLASIFQKLDVHSREELLAKLGQTLPDGADAPAGLA